MGISKGRGIAWAKRQLGRGGRVVVMTGDGELQEGQNWEALQSAAHQRLGRLWSCRRPQRAPVRQARPRRSSPSATSRRSCARSAGTSRAATDTTTRRFAGRSRPSRDGRRRPKALIARHDQGQGRLVHGAPRRARGRTAALPLARRRPGRRDLRARPRRARRRGSSGGSPTLGLGALAPSPSLRSTSEPVSLAGEPESGVGAAGAEVTDEYVAAAYGEALVELAATHDRARRARRRPRLRLPRRGFEDAYPGPVHRERHRRAGHGLDGGRPGAPRPATRRQLLRELPRLARERADLQPGERGTRSSTRCTTRG